MPANVYECMFLLDTAKVAGDVPAAAQQLHGILERNQAEILASRPWDDRRLAYPIGNQKKGLYYLTYFRAGGEAVGKIENDCSLNEMILRQLILKVEPKYVETMLAVARDEHALALQTVATDPDGDSSSERPDDGHGRRGGRRHHDDGGDKD